MESKWLKGILIGLVIVAVFVFGTLLGIIAIPTWIYLVVSLRKKRTGLIDDPFHQEQAIMRLKQIKLLLTIGGVSFLIAIPTIILHQAPVGISEDLAFAFFFIGIITLYVFAFATIIGLYLFLKYRKQIT